MQPMKNNVSALSKLDLVVAGLAGILGVATFLQPCCNSHWRCFDYIKTSPLNSTARVFRDTDTCCGDELLTKPGEAFEEFAIRSYRG